MNLSQPSRGFSIKALWPFLLSLLLILSLSPALIHAQEDEDYEEIDSSMCADCHEESANHSSFGEDLSHSVHDGLECQDCHQDKTTIPHKEEDEKFFVGCQGCRTCHEDIDEEYQAHGTKTIGTCGDIPHCSDCHGTHDILPASAARSTVHPSNLKETCGKCHNNIDLIKKYPALESHPLSVYEASVHGKIGKGGSHSAANCVDCHGTKGSAHQILAPSFKDSSIARANIPSTCGQCHKSVERDYWDGIHGKLFRQGETNAPICTDCHGEHGIFSPSDKNSPVSRSQLAGETCARCHNAMVLNEKYGVQGEKKTNFIDSYHGLKTQAGDPKVANCASCHGGHRILPSSDPSSSINPKHLRETCGECHPNISEKIAQTPIHGVGSKPVHTELSQLIQKFYIVLIILVIGGMLLHNALDYFRQIRAYLAKRPQIRRMRMDEVWQHTLLAVSFITLVITGFSMAYGDSWMAKFLFGWEGGFHMRGIIHRVAAVLMTLGAVWHLVYLFTRRGRKFIKDMLPTLKDVQFAINRFKSFIGMAEPLPCVQRFNYAEKAEYWALIWGTIVMCVTGGMLWFDNALSAWISREVFDVALTIHYWEAVLATLAIIVWHFYGVLFNPEVYPMNPAWLTGTMPEELYEHEHPGHLEEARAETDRLLARQRAKVRRSLGEDEGPDNKPIA